MNFIFIINTYSQLSDNNVIKLKYVLLPGSPSFALSATALFV